MRIRELDTIASTRGQTLAQMALQWALRDARMTSVVCGVSSVTQLEANVEALDGPPFDADQLSAIDATCGDAEV